MNYLPTAALIAALILTPPTPEFINKGAYGAACTSIDATTYSHPYYGPVLVAQCRYGWAYLVPTVNGPWFWAIVYSDNPNTGNN